MGFAAVKLKPTFCVTGLPPLVVDVGVGFGLFGVAVRCGAGVAVRVARGPPLSLPLSLLSLSPQPLVTANAATINPIVSPDLSVRIIVNVPPPLQRGRSGHGDPWALASRERVGARSNRPFKAWSSMGLQKCSARAARELHDFRKMRRRDWPRRVFTESDPPWM